MEMVVRKFNSHAEAELADRRELAAMSEQQRADIFFELRERSHPNDAFTQRFARVYRVLELQQS